MNRGKKVIVGIVGLALLAAAFSLAWRYRQTRTALEFWGPEAADLIARSSQVEAWSLERIRCDQAETPEGVVQAGDECYRILRSVDITDTPGFSHARHALTVNSSFNWNLDAVDCKPTWSHALAFSDGAQKAIVMLSFDCELTRLPDKDRIVGIKAIAGGLELVLDEQLGS